jgi:hypothetical protein
MNADVNGALANKKSWRFFTHKGKPIKPAEVEAILKYARNKGYKTTAELSDSEIEKFLSKPTGEKQC